MRQILVSDDYGNTVDCIICNCEMDYSDFDEDEDEGYEREDFYSDNIDFECKCMYSYLSEWEQEKYEEYQACESYEYDEDEDEEEDEEKTRRLLAPSRPVLYSFECKQLESESDCDYNVDDICGEDAEEEYWEDELGEDYWD